MREVGDVKLMARAVEGIEMKDLKSLADDGKKQIGSGVVAIVGVTEDGKAGVVVGVTGDLTSRFNAVDLVRKSAPRRSAARAAAAGPTWRRPAAPMAPRRMRRCRPSKRRWAAPEPWHPSRADSAMQRSRSAATGSTNCSNTISCPIRPARASPQLIIAIIIIDVLAMMLASVPEFDARFGRLFTVDRGRRRSLVFALEYAARLWSVAGHSPFGN